MNAVIARLEARLRSVNTETGSVVRSAKGSATKFHAFAQFGLACRSGQSATSASNKPAVFKKSMKNANCPKGAKAASRSYSTRTEPEKLSTLTPAGTSPTAPRD